MPDWVGQAAWRPDEALLKRLKAAVEAAPTDRRERNKYAWALLRAKRYPDLKAQALEWQGYDPGNPMVYEYLADVFVAADDEESALRAVSSIAEVSPNDSGLLNRGAFLALRAGKAVMAETLARFAIERRPDHQNNHRALALALWTQGRHEEAVGALADALKREYHGRYGNLPGVLREEAGLVLRAWLEARPGDGGKVRDLAKSLGCDLLRKVALRVTLHWETDANDVDLHVTDPSGEECFYSHKENASGLRLYEDLTQGLGPEVTVVPPGSLQKGAYHVGVKYFSAGPMGVSRGIVVILWPSEKGRPRTQIEPFCLLPDLEGNAQDMRHVAVVEAE